MKDYEDSFNYVKNIFSEKSIPIKTKNIFDKYQHYVIDYDSSNLFSVSIRLFSIINNYEKQNIPRDIIKDFTTLYILLFFWGYFTDTIVDDKKTENLYISNILLFELYQLSEKLDCNLSESIKRLEAYRLNENVLKIGKISIFDSLQKEKNQRKIIEGFIPAIDILETFQKKFLTDEKWGGFFTNYLIYRQILDDINDFTIDYNNGILKSFGIYAFNKRFYKKQTVNLKNPVIASLFHIYIIQNLQSLCKDFLDTFNKNFKSNTDKEFFFNTLSLIETYQE